MLAFSATTGKPTTLKTAMFAANFGKNDPEHDGHRNNEKRKTCVQTHFLVKSLGGI
jgi:hypothetical protein